MLRLHKVKKRKDFSDLTLKLSIILLSYNHEKTVARALDSLLAQKVDFEYEILVVEDCSTDKTAEIILSYKDKFKNFHLFFNKKRQGNSISGGKFNVEMIEKYIKGQYYCVLETDDCYVNETKLQQQINALDANPACVACGHNLLIVDEVKKTHYLQNNPALKDFLISFENLATRQLTIHNTTVVFRNIFIPYRTKLLWQLRSNDWTASFVYAYHGPIAYINAPMSCFFLTGEGVWSGRTKLREQIAFLIEAFYVNKLFHYQFDKFYYPRIINTIDDLEQLLPVMSKKYKLKKYKNKILILCLRLLRLLTFISHHIRAEKKSSRLYVLLTKPIHQKLKKWSEHSLLNKCLFTCLLLIVKISVMTKLCHMFVKAFMFLFEQFFIILPTMGMEYFRIKLYNLFGIGISYKKL